MGFGKNILEICNISLHIFIHLWAVHNFLFQYSIIYTNSINHSASTTLIKFLMFNIWRRLRKKDYLFKTCDLFIATWFRQTWLHHICNHVKRALENGHLLGNSLIKPETFQTKLGCNALHVTLIYIDLQYYNAHQATIIECARKFDISNMSLRIFFLWNATCYLPFLPFSSYRLIVQNFGGKGKINYSPPSFRVSIF